MLHVLIDELRAEQEAAQSYERERRLLESQAKDMQARLDEAEQTALKGGKKAMSKMDSRIRELESELDAENRRCTDSQKNQENLSAKSGADNHQMRTRRIMSACRVLLIIQGKIRTYKNRLRKPKRLLL